MRILYVALKYDYGKLEQGYSFEHYNFYHSLLHMGHDILYFDFMTLMQKHGRDWMNRRLLEVVKVEKPVLMFTVLFKDELDPAVVREISQNTETITLNWFCDDHWRFDNYARYWARCFNWVVTTAKRALPKYEKLGYRNVVKSQWACNHFLYRKLNLPLIYDVTFVGQPHSNRRQVIQALRNAGVDVHVWGRSWESGRISQEEMIRVFNQSRINLNLSHSSTPLSIHKGRVKNITHRWLSNYLKVIPFRSQIKTMSKQWLTAIKHSKIADGTQIRFYPGSRKYIDQIKGRNFEIPGCGGFLLTEMAEDLENYYKIGREIVCFDSIDDLIEKIDYYLHHEDERIAIAQAGYERTLCEHTYVHRFTEIFKQLGLQCKPLSYGLVGKVRLGQTEEIH
ncbi:MAG: glycosyltransferase [Acidobacteriota bacterium]